MLLRNQRGVLDPFLIPFAAALVLVIGLGFFGYWAYDNYTTQRDDVDVIVADAVSEAEAAQAATLEADFQEREKSPTRTYSTPSALGSVTVDYPKTWSVYVDEVSDGEIQVYMHPGFVSSPNSDVAEATRIYVQERSYANSLNEFQFKVENGQVSTSPITVSGEQGVRLDGEIFDGITGSLVLLPLRDKTLRVWTESTDFLDDFNNIILDSLTFEP